MDWTVQEHVIGKGEGRILATKAESQWIVAARPLCHLQYPSRGRAALPPNGLSQRHVPLGPAPTEGRQSGGGRMRRF
ncbi:unnamed protein product [Brassica napus]|nr:unnamed protein product [Brassica napus]